MCIIYNEHTTCTNLLAYYRLLTQEAIIFSKLIFIYFTRKLLTKMKKA